MKLMELIREREKDILRLDGLLDSLKNVDDDLISELTTLRLPLILVMVENSYAHKSNWARPYVLAYFQDLQKFSYVQGFKIELDEIFKEIETLFSLEELQK